MKTQLPQERKAYTVSDKNQPKVFIDKPILTSLTFNFDTMQKREQAQKHTRQNETVAHIKTHSVNHKPEHKDWAQISIK